jgi:uncharacterized membrane-anchored protein
MVMQGLLSKSLTAMLEIDRQTKFLILKSLMEMLAVGIQQLRSQEIHPWMNWHRMLYAASTGTALLVGRLLRFEF